MSLNLMLVPSTSCPARCLYCFGPRGNVAVMGKGILDATLVWLEDLQNRGPIDKLDVVFHGGEPLTAGIDFYCQALPRLRQTLKTKRQRLNMQSNLWLLTGELCELFAEYGVSLGTSLDGPEEITDNQRGRGYFSRTMAGIELARRHGLRVGCICTFTRQSVSHADEIIDFFIHEGLDFSIHAAVPPLVDNGLGQESDISCTQAARGAATDRWSLSPEAYGSLLVNLLDSYLSNLQRIRISTLDQLSRSISSWEGGICTYRDCLGCYLAIAPDGSIYPCQRFTGLSSFRLGHVQERPGPERLKQAPVWQMFREREERLREECGDCPRFNICKGGCPYNALAVGGGSFNSLKDPYCSSYRRIFSHITERALEEVFSEENMEAVVTQPDGSSLLRKGVLLTIMRGGSHPRQALQRNVVLVNGMTTEAVEDRVAECLKKSFGPVHFSAGCNHGHDHNHD